MNKLEEMTACLARGETYVVLDARQPGVDVPGEFSTDPELVLKFSYRYEAVHLQVNEWGIRADLQFGKHFWPVAVPWEAVYAIGPKGEQGLGWDKPGEPPVAVKRAGGLRLM